jgi:predicted DNA-binding WGR domain protein
MEPEKSKEFEILLKGLNSLIEMNLKNHPQFSLYKTARERIAIVDQDNKFIGLLIASFPKESANAFSYEYGTFYFRTDFRNIDDFEEISQSQFFAIEYLSEQEQQLYILPQLVNEPQQDTEIETTIYLEYELPNSKIKRFFRITQNELELIICSGNLGSEGITRTLKYNSIERAKLSLQDMVKNKESQGFIRKN